MRRGSQVPDASMHRVGADPGGGAVNQAEPGGRRSKPRGRRGDVGLGVGEARGQCKEPGGGVRACQGQALDTWRHPGLECA